MVTAADIQQLRQRTGVGMSKCKKALEEAHGDIELAIENLRKSGIASAVKKEGRATNEGAIAFHVEGERLALLELSAETDFVVNNEAFQSFLTHLARQVATSSVKTVEQLLEMPYIDEPSSTVEQQRAMIMQSLGENIQIKRLELIEKKTGEHFGLYSHMKGKIVSLALLRSDASTDDLKAIGTDLAMQITASKPEFLRPEEIPAEKLESEREIARSQLQGRPAHIMDNIIQGKLKAYYKEVCLLYQPFFKEPKKSVDDFVQEQSKALGQEIALERMLRWSIK